MFKFEFGQVVWCMFSNKPTPGTILQRACSASGSCVGASVPYPFNSIFSYDGARYDVSGALVSEADLAATKEELLAKLFG